MSPADFLKDNAALALKLAFIEDGMAQHVSEQVDPKPYINCETGIAEGTRGVWGELKRPWEARYGATDEEQVDEAIA